MRLNYVNVRKKIIFKKTRTLTSLPQKYNEYTDERFKAFKFWVLSAARRATIASIVLIQFDCIRVYFAH